MKQTKQTVYLPINGEDVKEYSKHVINCEECKYLTDDYQYTCTRCWNEGGNGKLSFNDVFKTQEGYFFTQEQLNQLLSDVIKDALNTAAENGKVLMTDNCSDHTPYRGACCLCGELSNYSVPTEEINKESITNTFEETFKKFKA